MSKSVYAGAALALAFTALFASTAIADDWTAVKLRGAVLALYDGDWVKLKRGSVIPDDQPIRTLASGRVTFQRGGESIDLGPNTQVQIFDRAGYNKFTTVKQYFGRVAVEAEVRDVTHFGVQTPYLAAVVKGTRFVVISGDRGAQVQVERGAVAVESATDRSSVVVAAGQQVSATSNAVMSVSGRGELPQVMDVSGKPVADAPNSRANANAFGGRGKSEQGRADAGSARGRGGGNSDFGGGNGNSGNGNGGGNGNSGGGNGNSGGGNGNSGGGHGNSGGGNGNSGGGNGNSGGGNGNSGGGNGNSGGGNGNSGGGSENAGGGSENAGGGNGNGGGNNGKGN